MPLPISALVNIKITHASAIPNATGSVHSWASPLLNTFLLVYYCQSKLRNREFRLEDWLLLSESLSIGFIQHSTSSTPGVPSRSSCLVHSSRHSLLSSLILTSCDKSIFMSVPKLIDIPKCDRHNTYVHTYSHCENRSLIQNMHPAKKC